jgi:hypothetical protein
VKRAYSLTDAIYMVKELKLPEDLRGRYLTGGLSLN